jgi:HSP20 family protein
MRDLIPWRRPHAAERRRQSDYDVSVSPFFTLRREMDRLFDDAFAGFASDRLSWPQIEVIERDETIEVIAELPGLDSEDVDLRVEDNVLVVSGEKRASADDEERRYSERYYGRFERRLHLGAEVDTTRAEVRFRSGVLKVTLPKTQRAVQDRKRIAIAP